MAKNFVEEGKTVAIVASAAISSGDLVQVGDVFAVALTDIPQGETGDGLTEGVFMLPKLKTDDMKTGKKVYLKSGKVQLTNSGSDPLVGVVWADAGTTTEVMADPMNRHTQIRQVVLARLREQCGDSATFFDGLPAFVDAQELPAVAVWLSDAQYTGKMTDEDDWQAVLHIAVFIRAQAPDSELDMWMESTIFPALNDVPALSGLIDTLIPLGFNYQRDNEMATWAMAEITYQITYTN
ncbi:DUF2190 family protein [Escherichia coli]|nr:DUF2190 family protein [Escherichia coli]